MVLRHLSRTDRVSPFPHFSSILIRHWVTLCPKRLLFALSVRYGHYDKERVPFFEPLHNHFLIGNKSFMSQNIHASIDST